MDPESIVATILSSLLSTDLVSRVFRQIFPVGASVNIPIDPVTVQEGVFEATLCPGGCGARVTIQNLDVSVMRTDRFPIVARIALDVSVASVVNGRRAPLPLVTSGGDFLVDIDTGRGNTDLKFKTQVVFGSPTTPKYHFRVNPALLPSAMREFNTSVDIAEIVPVPGFELEAADIQFTGTSVGGRTAARVIAAYQDEMVPYMRRMVGYLLNKLLCDRFGTSCPERPMPEFPTLSLPISPIVVAAGLITLIVGGVYLWKRSKRGDLGTIPPTPDGDDKVVLWGRKTFDPGTRIR